MPVPKRFTGPMAGAGMDAARDPKAFVLTVPRAAPPGKVYRYNSLTSYVAGVVVTEATGKPMDVFARQYLFAPLGIQRWQWARDASGITKGQGNLSLRARDFCASPPATAATRSTCCRAGRWWWPLTPARTARGTASCAQRRF